MGLDVAHYHGWSGTLRSPWWACLSIVRVSIMQVFRRKIYWLAIGLGLLNFLAYWVGIYIVTQFPMPPQAKEMALKQIGFTADPTAEENGYIQFMQSQSRIVMILLAFSGGLLVGSDFRQNALPFYLSRRIDRRHYIAAKLLAVATIVALLTVVPALLLFVEYGMFTSSIDYWLDNWRVPLSVIGYGLVLSTVLSILLVTLSAYLQRAAPIAITWSSLFVLLALIAGQLRQANDNKYWHLLDPWRAMRYVGQLFFDKLSDPVDHRIAMYAALMLTSICIVSLIALVRRVRAVEIVE